MTDLIKLFKQHAGIADNPDQEGLDVFAELIIQQCLSAVDTLVDRNEDGSWTTNELYTDYNGALHLVDYEIRKTFGVEE
jgi:hypothetical protein